MKENDNPNDAGQQAGANPVNGEPFNPPIDPTEYLQPKGEKDSTIKSRDLPPDYIDGTLVKADIWKIWRECGL